MPISSSRRKTTPLTLVALTALMLSATPTYAQTPGPQPQPDCRTFPETGKSVCGRFLQYWDANGALPQQGFPISSEFQEVSDIDGKSYTVQYFERAVFEMHPENAAPYDVLLTLLGRIELQNDYPGGATDTGETTLPAGPSQLFPETDKTVSGPFLDYWQRNGGLAQQGFPLTNAMYDNNTPTAAQPRIVQYFERAVFEWHPENDDPFKVLLARLGAERFEEKYPKGEPGAGGDVWADLSARPLVLEPLAFGKECRPTVAAPVNATFGDGLGPGPLYPVGFSPEGVYDFTFSSQEGDYFLLKVLWTLDPTRYSGPILVRGRQLDGIDTLYFGGPGVSQDELRLDPAEALDNSNGNWPNWPTYTRLSKPGCYAYQLDGIDFTTTITFLAIIKPAP